MDSRSTPNQSWPNAASSLATGVDWLMYKMPPNCHAQRQSCRSLYRRRLPALIPCKYKTLDSGPLTRQKKGVA
eukprot:347759-Amphidinium_carterae.1